MWAREIANIAQIIWCTTSQTGATHLPMPTVRPRHQITETPEVEATRGKYADAFGADYVAQLRRNWPE